MVQRRIEIDMFGQVCLDGRYLGLVEHVDEEQIPPELLDEFEAAVEAHADGYDPAEEAGYAHDATRGSFRS